MPTSSMMMNRMLGVFGAAAACAGDQARMASASISPASTAGIRGRWSSHIEFATETACELVVVIADSPGHRPSLVGHPPVKEQANIGLANPRRHFGRPSDQYIAAAVPARSIPELK